MRTNNRINLGNLLLSFSDAIDLVSPQIPRHQQRTAYIAWGICRRMSLPDETARNIFIASLLRDIGAITVEDKLSLYRIKNSKSAKHCLRGELLLKRLSGFGRVADIIRHHRMKWSEWKEPAGGD